MEAGRAIRAFDYVNHPYAQVRRALMGEVGELFKDATRSAASRARDVAAGLRVNIAGLEVGAPISISVLGREQKSGKFPTDETTTLAVEWEAAKAPRLFPLMKGTLSAYPLTATETQLEFDGHYKVPGGVVGGAIDAMVGHRIAEASVHRFVSDVARYLRSTLE